MMNTKYGDGTSHRLRYDQSVSTYRLTQRELITYLRRIFGKGDFHVRQSNDMFNMSLPRPLTAEEHEELDNVLRHQDPEPNMSLRSSAEWEALKRASFTPMIRGLNQNDFKLSSEDNIKDLSLIYSISRARISRQGIASSLYVTYVGQGFTSEVFEVDARWSSARQDAMQYDEPRSLKVAVKRLSRYTRPGQFLQEYDALKAATRAHHRNIVELLNAFTYEDEEKVSHYNFSFPLAIGNLKELFSHHLAHKPSGESNLNSSVTAHRLSDDFYSIATQSLWSEFEGLGSALAHLHTKCHIAHSDIKPSNVLLYGPYGNPPIITAKLTDFGLAVDLKTRLIWRRGSKEAQSAWQYDAPEVRRAFAGGQALFSNTNLTSITYDVIPQLFMSGDVWKLGSVFIEMLTFLVEGLHSTQRFREFITTTVGSLTSDDLGDSRFDDGKKVKVEVLQWLSRLATKDLRAQEMQGLLRSMLDTSSQRPSSNYVAQVLKSFSVCLYSDGARILNFTSFNFVRRPPFVDRCKQMIEKRVGYPLDWRPFKDGIRWCAKGNSRITWYWFSKKLYIDVPDAQAQAYKHRCQAISDFAETASHPSQPSPAYLNSDRQVPSPFIIDMNSSTDGYPLSSLPSRYRRQDRLSDVLENDSADEGHLSPRNSYKEIYWCVDKAWSEPRSTKLCSLREHPEIRDDKSLCELLIKEYNRVRAWKGRTLSWKSCLGIEFIKFARSSTGNDDIVRVQIGLPPSSATSYEISRLIPEEVHMRIAATELIAGIYQPHEGRGRTTTLNMIPKRIRTADGTDPEDWGMHALPRFSLWKILAWIAFLTIFGLAFVIFWLVFINKTDLQNAFIPFTFLATMVMIGLGIPQLLEVD